MHTFLGVADADINLELFGLGDLPDRTAPGLTYTIAARGRDLRLAAMTPSLTLDTRDNVFTPTRGP